MVSYANGTDPKHFKMTFYDSLGVFKPIFGDFDFFRLVSRPSDPVKVEESWKIGIFGKFWQPLPKIGDFGHLKIWQKNGWKPTNIDAKIDFLDILLTLAHF